MQGPAFSAWASVWRAVTRGHLVIPAAGTVVWCGVEGVLEESWRAQPQLRGLGHNVNFTMQEDVDLRPLILYCKNIYLRSCMCRHSVSTVTVCRYMLILLVDVENRNKYFSLLYLTELHKLLELTVASCMVCTC